MIDKNDRILRDKEVFEITKLSKSTRWRLEKAGKFPKKVQLSPNAVGWLESDIISWLEQRVLSSLGDIRKTNSIS